MFNNKRILKSLLLLALSNSAIFAKNYDYYKEEIALRGYAPYVSQVTKRTHEVGSILGFSYFSDPAVGRLVHFMFGPTYQYNFNPYASWQAELSSGVDLLFLEKKVGQVQSLTQLSLSLLTGARVYPWKNWFFFGAGIGVRYFQAITPDIPAPAGVPSNLLPKNWREQAFKAGLKQTFGTDNTFSITPEYYAELGLLFPTKYLNFELGYRWRGSILGPIQKIFDAPTDPQTHFNVGEITIRLTIPLGKQAKTSEEKWLRSLFDLEADEIKMKITDVYFPADNVDLDEKGRQSLNRLLPVIAHLNPRDIIIRGHAFNIGDEKKENEVAEGRAQTVKKYLESLGVRGVVIQSAGSTEPWDGAATEKQRRVSVILIR